MESPTTSGSAATAAITVQQAAARMAAGASLIDIRELHERVSGMAEGARGASRDEVERDPSAHLAQADTDTLLICQSGRRSAELAAVLHAGGHTRVVSVEGGTSAWMQAGLPVVRPVLPPAEAAQLERYSRHLRLPQVGAQGQRRLRAARVTVVGAGGLGSPAAFYLAAAGIGTVRLIDDDVVERSNLQRQILHVDAAVGMPKVMSAAQRLEALNPDVRVEAVQERLSVDNVERVLDGTDVVIDGADNFATRYLLNDACVKLGKPMVYGAVQQFEGQVSVFDAGRHRGQSPCYRCLFPEPPPAAFAPNCAEAGVLGVLPGVIGLLQATEAIKLLLGIGDPLRGRLLGFDALGMHFRELRLPPDPACAVCAADMPFPGYIDYPAFCATSGT